MSGTEAVNPWQRRKFVTLVQRHPGRTAAELEGLLSVHDRCLLGPVLRSARECCIVRVDDDGRIWPTA